MKPTAAFTLGLATGLGLFAAFNLWKTSTHSPSASPASPPVNAHPVSDSLSTPASSSETSSTLSPTSSASLESALREIREAGMVVIPQELARFYTPRLKISPDGEMAPDIAVGLQLDPGERAAFNHASFKLRQNLFAEIARHMQPEPSGDDSLRFKIPAFPEARAALIASFKAELSQHLDPDSAGLLNYIDVDNIAGAEKIGNHDSTLQVRKAPKSNGYNLVITTGGKASSLGISSELLTRIYPELAGKLAQYSVK